MLAFNRQNRHDFSIVDGNEAIAVLANEVFFNPANKRVDSLAIGARRRGGFDVAELDEFIDRKTNTARSDHRRNPNKRRASARISKDNPR